MSMDEFLKKKVGAELGIISGGFPKEHLRVGKLLGVDMGVAIIQDNKGREWAIPLDKILMIGPPEMEQDERSAGFR